MSIGLDISLDQAGDGKAFDAAQKGTLPWGDDLRIITKSKGTVEGQAIVMMTFTVRLPDGSLAKAHAVTTARHFVTAAAAVIGAHPGCDERSGFPLPESPATIEGKHRGVGWTAVYMERLYLINTEESGIGIALAMTEREVAPLAEGIIDKALKRRLNG